MISKFCGQSPSLDKIKILFWSMISLVIIDREIAIAQTAKIQPQLPPELERLEYFEGTWICQQPAGSTKAASNFTWTVKQDVNQFWYLGTAQQIEPTPNRLPINSRDFMGYDSASQQLIKSVIVGNGNSYNLVAQDWENNKLIWSGIIVRKGKAVQLRKEIIKDSPHKFTARYFFPNETGKWIPVVDESCDRQPRAPK